MTLIDCVTVSVTERSPTIIASAFSMIGRYSTARPGSSPPDEVTIDFGGESWMRTASSLRREAAEDHRVHGADAGAGEHRDTASGVIGR